MLLVNQMQASSVRLVTPWLGVWFADVELVLDETAIAPVGPCVLTLGTSVLTGWINPSASGAFAKTAKAQIVGGSNGWDKKVLPLPFSNPAGVVSTAVYAATAAEVLETVVDVVPSVLGSTTYLRHAGPASAVFGDRDWYVTRQGVTMVGPRVPMPYDPTSAEILSFDPLLRIATVSSDAPIEPGTILLDPLRFDGPLVVRDVEQTWGEAGARATCWCGESKGSRLGGALSALVAHKAGLPYLKTWLYRVVLQPETDSLALQIVDLLSGAPDALPIDIWYGVPGVSSKLLLGTEVLVAFANGDPGKPCVVGFKSGDAPIELSIAALKVTVGLGSSQVALATPLLAWCAKVETQLSAAGFPLSPPVAASMAIPSLLLGSD